MKLDTFAKVGLGLVLAISMGCGAATEGDVAQLQAALGGRGSGFGTSFGGTGGVASVTVDLFNGGGAPASPTIVQDATIEAAVPNTNAGADPYCIADGKTQERSCLLVFDVSVIPSTARVFDASLSVSITGTSISVFNLFAVNQAWSGASVTWNNRLAATPWVAPGAKDTSDREATPFTTMAPTFTGQLLIPFGAAGTALVQKWVTGGTSANHGFLIARPNTTDGMSFASSESPDVRARPHLTVRYVP